MNNRQKLVQQQYLNNEKAVLRQLKKSYTDSLVAINDTVKNLQLSIDGLQQEYDWMDDNDPQKAIVKSKIQSKIYQKQYQEQLQSQVGGILSEMQKSQFVTVSDYLDKCYEDGFIGSIFDLHGQGVPLTMPINQESMVKAVQLDSKISKGLYTKLGEDVDLLKKRITSEVTRAIATGSTYAQTAQRLAGQTNIGFNKAARIARTEGHRIQNSAADDAAHLARDRGADVVKQWDSTLDGHTRESHVAVDGQIRELDEEFSNGLMFPGDPRGSAAEVVNCRCAYLQRARWAVGGSFTKMNNFTGQIETFDSPQGYDEFKKAFFSDENKKCMNYVEQMQDKYGTKDFATVLYSMDDREYKHYSNLLKSNPVYNKKTTPTDELAQLKAKLETLNPTDNFVDWYSTSKRIKELESQIVTAAVQKTDDVSESIYKTITSSKDAEGQLKNIGFKAVDDRIAVLNKDMVVDSVNQLTRLEEKFGAVKQGNVTLDVSNARKARAFVSSWGGDSRSQELSFTGYFKKTKSEIIDTLADEISDGFHMKVLRENYSVYTVTHEYGHIIENDILGKLFSSLSPLRQNELDSDGFKLSTWRNEQAGKIRSEIVAIAKEASGDSMFLSWDHVSTYGKTNNYEFFAEVFANSQLGEPNILGDAMNVWLKQNGWGV